MLDLDAGAEVKELKLEKGAGDGVDVGTCPFALLPCVMDESNAGPGISAAVSYVRRLKFHHATY